jgi:hypothetical protein
MVGFRELGWEFGSQRWKQQHWGGMGTARALQHETVRKGVLKMVAKIKIVLGVNRLAVVGMATLSNSMVSFTALESAKQSPLFP